jgi:type II secretory pathway component GspD/PulD (secretin)
MMKLLTSLVLALVVYSGTVYAASIETIQLKNRPAEEIIPLIKPMLGPDDSISGQGFQLFIRTSDENLEQIAKMIARLDVAVKQLLISVFQGSERDLRAIGVSGGVEFQSDRVDASIGKTGGPSRGADVQYSTRNATVSGNTLSTRGRLADNPVHQLRITEGTEGYIETGESIPYFSGGVWLGRHRGAVDAGVDYKDIHTGFYVLPRVHGEQVTMDVSPYKQSRSKTQGGAIDTQRASTTVTGQLGVWLQIGGVTEQTSRSRTDIGSYSSTQSRNNAGIWIKADLVQ